MILFIAFLLFLILIGFGGLVAIIPWLLLAAFLIYLVTIYGSR